MPDLTVLVNGHAQNPSNQSRGARGVVLTQLKGTNLGFIFTLVSSKSSLTARWLTASHVTQNQCPYFIVVHAHIGFALSLGCVSINLSSIPSILLTISVTLNMVAMSIATQHPKGKECVEDEGEPSESEGGVGDPMYKNLAALITTIIAVVMCFVGIVCMWATRR